MTRIELIRNTWTPWRGRVDWRHRYSFDVNLACDASSSPLIFEEIPTYSTTTRITFHREHCYYVNDGELYEWRNIVCEGNIIDMEWIQECLFK